MMFDPKNVTKQAGWRNTRCLIMIAVKSLEKAELAMKSASLASQALYYQRKREIRSYGPTFERVDLGLRITNLIKICLARIPPY